MTYEPKFPLLDAMVEDVADAEPLLRRIRPEYCKGADKAPSSAAFKTAELSVDRERMLERGPLQAGESFPEHGISRIPSAKTPRDFGLDVIKAARPENMAHALVLGKKTDSTAKKLARSVEVLKPAKLAASSQRLPVEAGERPAAEPTSDVSHPGLSATPAPRPTAPGASEPPPTAEGSA